ncbi:protein FADD [Lampris incognitus]|uniref:protein FADD n=1 Tax=Lampris incognitus TaxID=2546036 RepID=UPI0024B5B6E5|nr:protein FADD [Lampris incognitus]
MSSAAFHSVLLDISNELHGEQLEKMKFLCKSHIGKNQLEKIDTGFKLFQALMERNLLDASNTELLRGVLRRVGREDLVGKLSGTNEHVAGRSDAQPDEQPDEAERVKLDAAADVIAENIGRTWRKFGRKLRLSEVKLDSIAKRHPSDLEETVLDLLREWRKGQGREACVKDLINALRACDHNFTAHKVETKLSAMSRPLT